VFKIGIPAEKKIHFHPVIITHLPSPDYSAEIMIRWRIIVRNNKIQNTVSLFITIFFLKTVLIIGPGYRCRTSPDEYGIRPLHTALQHPVSITASLLILTRIVQNYRNRSDLNGF